MGRQSLQFRFHDPNPAGIIADLLPRLLVQANQSRLEEALRQAAAAPPAESGAGSRAENRDSFLTLG